MDAALTVAQPFHRLAALGGEEELEPGIVRAFAGLGEFALKLTAALVQEDGIDAQLLQLNRARAGGQLGTVRVLGSVNLGFDPAHPPGGGFRRGVRPGALLLGGLLRLFAQREHGVETKTVGFHEVLAGTILGAGSGSRVLASSDHDWSPVKLSVTPCRRNRRSGSCRAMASSMAALLPVG